MSLVGQFYIAGDSMPVSDFARDRILSDYLDKPKPRRRSPTKELEAAGRILGELGRTRIASNLNQLAKQANAGSLVLTPEIQTALLPACADIRQIRNLLLKMQGLSKAHDE